MKFLDNLGKTLSTTVDRAKFEADKFQRTSKINGEIGNLRSQIETNTRQLGERALELYQQGALHAPEIASLAQIIAQLQEQQTAKQQELEQASGETFEQYQAANPQPAAEPVAPPQNVPILREPDETGFPTPTSSTSEALPPLSTDVSGTGLPNASSIGGTPGSTAMPDTCPGCGYTLSGDAVFCPNCGARVKSS